MFVNTLYHVMISPFCVVKGLFLPLKDQLLQRQIHTTVSVSYINLPKYKTINDCIVYIFLLFSASYCNSLHIYWAWNNQCT